MVIFQLEECGKTDGITARFTFQYGYISTKNIDTKNTVRGSFTFQYGYISTSLTAPLKPALPIFTFQYGYISTGNKVNQKSFEEGIYIPIWLYFNARQLKTKTVDIAFTFQYGYISTWD